MRKGSERRQLCEGKRAFAYGKFSLSPTVYQRCIILKTFQKITSDSDFTAYLVDVAEAFDNIDAVQHTLSLYIDE